MINQESTLTWGCVRAVCGSHELYRHCNYSKGQSNKIIICICYGPVTMHQVIIKKIKKTLLRNDSCMLGRQVCSCWGLTFHTCKTPLSKWERVSDEEDFVIMSSVTIGHGCDFPPQFYSLGRFKVTNRGDGSPAPSTNLDWCYDDISRIF